MRVVVDAGVGIKWVIRNPLIEPNVEQALILLRGVRARSVEALAPPHFKAEVLAVVARARPSLVPITFGILNSISLNIVGTESAYRRAADLAIGLNHHMFDTLYHSIALETGATCVTADRHYFAKASARGGIQALSAFTL